MRQIEGNNQNFLKNWINPSGSRKVVSVLLILAMILGTAAVVYVTGGIKYVYSHFMYVPILLAGIIFRVPGGLLAALCAGLLLGPYMPIDTQTGEVQVLGNWIFRMGSFFIIGGLSGYVMDYMEKQVTRMQWMMEHELESGLPNRNILQRDFINISRKKDYQKILVTLISIRNLDEVNNTFGSIPGDQFLLRVVERLRKIIPSSLQLYALRSNRYAVLVPQDDAQKDVIQPIITRMAESVNTFGIPLYADIGIGTAKYPQHGSTLDEIIKKAESALKRAENRGIQYSSFELITEKRTRNASILMGQVPEAIRNNEFRIFYQPIVSIMPNQNPGLAVEALARWQHPERGLLTPGDFIPQMETTSLIQHFTHWIITTSLDQFRAWQKERILSRIAINITVRNLFEQDFVDFVDTQLRKLNIPRGSMDFELTESTIMTDLAGSTRVMKELNSIGVNLILDDFGIGQSSLSVLKDLPLKAIKIDQEFIGDMIFDIKKNEIVKASLSICKAVGYDTIAEGVEDERTLDKLKGMGCGYAQGYYFTRPQPAEQMTQWLRENQRWGYKFG